MRSQIHETSFLQSSPAAKAVKHLTRWWYCAFLHIVLPSVCYFINIPCLWSTPILMADLEYSSVTVLSYSYIQFIRR